MPLPVDPKTPWPPKSVADLGKTYTKWAAWWSGDVDALTAVYTHAVGYANDPIIGSNDTRPPLVQLRPRMFYGEMPARGALQSSKLHIPLASDIAMTSADLLFGEPPALVAAEDKGLASDTAAGKTPALVTTVSQTQEFFDDVLAGGLEAVLLEAAEISSAFGGVYLRVGWDAQVSPDLPIFDAIPPDTAVPEFRSGQMIAVTFYRKLTDQGPDGAIWRHLERHEAGVIFHGLYRTTDPHLLGTPQKLDAHPETAPFAGLPGGGERVETGATGLAAEYVPNMRPNRIQRGSQLGRSDYDGIESVMDRLDEAWSSWMRDLRQGKGRIHVPESYLAGQGRGNGALFDHEQEVYQLVDALPTSTGGLMMQQVQFNIRVAEHAATTQALMEQAVRGAGYAAQSFGLQGDTALTATEVSARQSRSYMTRGKKINYFRPPLRRLIRAAAQIATKQLSVKGLSADLPGVEWPDGIATDPQTLATTLSLLKAAEAASTSTRVEMLHPDWDKDRIDEEVKKINAEGMPPAGADMPAFPGSGITNPPKNPPAAGFPAAAGAATSDTAGGDGAKPAGPPRPAPPVAPARGPGTRRPPGLRIPAARPTATKA